MSRASGVPSSDRAGDGRPGGGSEELRDDLQAALERAGCLGTWMHDVGSDTLMLSSTFAAFLGVPHDAAGTRLDLSRWLSAVHVEDRLRIESVLFAASEAGGVFEAEFRLEQGGTRRVRLMGRSAAEPDRRIRSRGLAFDLTRTGLSEGTPAQQTQRRVNELADHVIALKGLVGPLRNTPLSQLVDRVAVEVGFEVARQLHGAESGPRH